MVSSGLVAYFTTDIFLELRERQHYRWNVMRMLRFIAYFFWLVGQIIKANIHVLKLSFSDRPKDVLNPQIIRFNTRLESDFARFVLGNSITLTPGTVTVIVNRDEITVHAIDETVAKDIPGEMEDRIARVFEP